MKNITVPIITEEYKINVVIGTLKELKTIKTILEDDYLDSRRGVCINRLQDREHPLILLNGDYDYVTCIATLAHEASHAMDYIQLYLGISDSNGEIHAHGIASVLRHCLKYIK